MRQNGPLQDPSNLYVLIPNLISQIAILLVKLCLIPTIASTFLTITFFILFFSCSGFSNVLPSRFSARLPQLRCIPLKQFILRGVRSFHFHGCVQFVSLPRFWCYASCTANLKKFTWFQNCQFQFKRKNVSFLFIHLE